MKKITHIDEQIEEVQKLLDITSPVGPDYIQLLELLERLSKVKVDLKDDDELSKDTIVIAATNILGILLIIGYEHGHVLTSKAVGLIMKGRV